MTTITEGVNEYEVLYSAHLEYTDVSENSNKFWETLTLRLTFNGLAARGVSGRTPADYAVKTTWGRIGTEGQVKFKEFSSHGSAMECSETGVREKLKKGYVTASSTPKAPLVPKETAKKLKRIEVETEWDLT